MPPGFLKAALRDFEAYTPGQQPPDGEGWVKLNTNESPWPPAPSVLAAVRAAVGGELRLYPDPMARAARAAIAEFHRLPPQWVSVGNGGDELLTLAFRAFVGSGDAVAFLDPSYPLLASLAALHEARANLHPLDAEWAPPKSFAEDDCVLKILVNPNSPTGTWVGREAVREVVESSPGVVVLDEAYVDFAPADQVDLVRAGAPNLIILRTFSKSYALAGMRLGYALAPPPLIEALDLVKDSYNVDRLAIVAARAAILDSE
ncbi:MAG: pyridoxal phosphate-dependent aminotransferase, partial [Candidatus Dormibacteraceae bacterium]